MENKFEDAVIPITSLMSGYGFDVAPRVYGLCVQIVNVCFIACDDGGFVLVDAGVPRSADEIEHAAKERFNLTGLPRAIILTHGHFDHVGSIIHLIEHWDVPVYAHEAELPYLTGQRDYPKGNAEVGGLVSRMSPMFPNHSINLDNHVQTLPEDRHVPHLPGWEWIHTPGHTPGHISLYRSSDGTLVAGDALTTVEQRSLYDVFTQKEELHGPPPYFTSDWEAATTSVQQLAGLRPKRLITGHGPLMAETDTFSLGDVLETFAQNFAETEVPI